MYQHIKVTFRFLGVNSIVFLDRLAYSALINPLTAVEKINNIKLLISVLLKVALPSSLPMTLKMALTFSDRLCRNTDFTRGRAK